MAIVVLWNARITCAQQVPDPIQFNNGPATPAIKPILGIVILLLALFCLLKPMAMRLLTRHHHQPAPQRVAPRRRPFVRLGIVAMILVLLIGGIAAFINFGPSLSTSPDSDQPAPIFQAQAGSFFTASPDDPFRSPTVKQIALPTFAGNHAIWGATGRDERGHIWIGVTSSEQVGSAHLMELDPETGQTTDHGNVIDELKRLGLDRPGEKQAKIHSKIYQSHDGFLYFASMDEEGEEEDGSRMPIWGGHLWRMRMSDGRWEHLAATPEALIAVGVGGNWVYALGYFGHVLYQFDTRTETIRSLHIDAVAGHVSRNFLVDNRGHTYVPRLRAAVADKANGPPRYVASLIECDPLMQEITETPLRHYHTENVIKSHGMTGLVYLANGSMVFSTHVGYLYRIDPGTDDAPATVHELGWFHSNGTAYAPALFTFAGQRYLAGVTKRATNEHQWTVFDLVSETSTSSPLQVQPAEQPPLENLKLYGSLTRDNQGRFYLVGQHQISDEKFPLLLQIQP